MKEISKITLGTAQIGMNYGIANTEGKPSFNSSINLLKFAWEKGINSFDTAPVYGNSEEIIGSFIESEIGSAIKNLIIISKLSKIEIKSPLTFNIIYDYIRKQINNSLNNLKIKRIPIYLLHNASDLNLNKGVVVECLEQLKKEGQIEHFGVSVYNPEDVKACMEYKEIDVIQIPINIFDMRLIKTGLLKKLSKNNYIILGRSIYLQGLFFIKPENLPIKLKIVEKELRKLRALAEEYKIEVAKLAFLFVRDVPEISTMVIGAEKTEQIAYNINLLKEQPLDKDLRSKIIENFSDLPERIINPSLWNN